MAASINCSVLLVEGMWLNSSFHLSPLQLPLPTAGVFICVLFTPSHLDTFCCLSLAKCKGFGCKCSAVLTCSTARSWPGVQAIPAETSSVTASSDIYQSHLLVVQTHGEAVG